ncbi:MAG: hypothetical protein JXB50_14330 [Spirochaetes bacterium]|nr:hypothetical protein [Spirochaetota bacterium]
MKTQKRSLQFKIDECSLVKTSILEKNPSIEKIFYFKSSRDDTEYKILLFKKNFQSNHIGIIQKSGKHLSRLYESKLKMKNSITGFIGTDLTDHRTLFFNFNMSTGKLNILKKVCDLNNFGGKK